MNSIYESKIITASVTVERKDIEPELKRHTRFGRLLCRWFWHKTSLYREDNVVYAECDRCGEEVFVDFNDNIRMGIIRTKKRVQLMSDYSLYGGHSNCIIEGLQEPE